MARTPGRIADQGDALQGSGEGVKVLICHFVRFALKGKPFEPGERNLLYEEAAMHPR